MKILHLDSNHDMIYEELSALGIENHVDLKSTKSEIENIISNYHGIVCLLYTSPSPRDPE